MKEYALKRYFDVSVSFLILLLIAPILLILAVIVKLSSPGPIIFRQQRVGRQGKPFWLFKFRTMWMNNSGPAVTSGNDSRITPIGRFLRKWKLDELPQFFNVLRGDMSLVGPRPEVEKYIAYYSEEQRRILQVRPGITGVSQLQFRHEELLLAGQQDVEGFYIREVLPAKLDLDLQYIRRQSLQYDLSLLFHTAFSVMR